MLKLVIVLYNGGKLNTMPKVSQEIKDLIMKKKDDYKKQIFAAIAELELPVKP